MDGLKLLTAMTGNNPRIKKIIITGYPSLENAIEAVNQGADAYIVKPFTMESLLLKIKVQLQKQKDELRHSEERVKEYIVSRGKARNPKTSKLKRS
jgi:DNA-binding NtrC family response regulator